MARLGNEGEEGAAHTLRQVEVGLVVGCTFVLFIGTVAAMPLKVDYVN